MNITVSEAVLAFQRGEFVIIIDGQDREDEGDLALAVETAKARAVGDMCHWAGGIFCMAFPARRHDELAIPLLKSSFRNEDTPFGEPVDLLGMESAAASAQGRLETARAILDPKSQPRHFGRPGHLITLRGRDKGLEEREGHTEAVIELAKMAGLKPAGFISEILYGTRMARGPSLEAFARRHKIGIISIKEIKGGRR